MRTVNRKIAVSLLLLMNSGLVFASPQMRVSGRVEADGVPGFDSIRSEIENGTPEFFRSAIEVEDELAGSWRYYARADSTVPALHIFGSLTNHTGNTLGNLEIGPLNVFASYTDTITLTPNDISPYRVTVDLVVDGTLDIDGSQSRAAADLNVAPENHGPAIDFRAYLASGEIHDTLSAQYVFSGDAVFDIAASLQFSILQINPGLSASGEFTHSAIVNLTITDLNGNPLSLDEVQVSSASGYFNTAVVPLPASLTMFGVGLLAIFGRVRAWMT